MNVRLEARERGSIPTNQQSCRIHGDADVPNGQAEVDQVRVVRRVCSLVVELQLKSKVVDPAEGKGREGENKGQRIDVMSGEHKNNSRRSASHASPSVVGHIGDWRGENEQFVHVLFGGNQPWGHRVAELNAKNVQGCRGSSVLSASKRRRAQLKHQHLAVLRPESLPSSRATRCIPRTKGMGPPNASAFNSSVLGKSPQVPVTTKDSLK